MSPSWEEWLARLLSHAAAVLDAPGLKLEEFGSEAEYRRYFDDGVTPERAFAEARSYRQNE
jgi:hypothetical protein